MDYAVTPPTPAPAAVSPEIQAMLDKMDAYEKQKQGEGYAVRRVSLGPTGSGNSLESLVGVGAPVESFFDLGHQFTTNKGKVAKTGANSSGTIYGDANKVYTLVNERGKNQTVFSGSGVEALDKIYALSQQLSQDGGKKAQWRVDVTDPVTGQTLNMADDDRPSNLVGKIMDIALPIAASFIPIPGVGQALGMALGAAGGSAVSGALQGKSLGKILKGAALSGGLSFAGGQALGGLGGGGGAAGSGAAGAAGSAAGGALGALPGEIVVQGIKNSIPGALGGALGGAAGGAAAGALGGGSGASPSDIVVQGVKPAGTALPGAIGAVGGGVSGSFLDDIVVEGSKPLGPQLGPEGLSAATIASLTAMPAIQQAAASQGLTADKLVNYLQAAGLLTGLVGNVLGGGGGSTKPGTMPGPMGSLGPGFSKPLPGATLPGLAPGTGGARTMPERDWNRYAFGPEASFFNHVPQTPQHFAKGGLVEKLSVLPSERGEFDESIAVRGKPGDLSRRKLSMDEMLTVDPVGRKRSRDVAEKEERIQEGLQRQYNTDRMVMRPDALRKKWDWWLNGETFKEREYAKGGLAVKGKGSGRSDDIPAMLSDGEYVVDAETVALLGDGSSKAGADALEALRVAVRKHKGKALAKGDFSVKAKKPDKYLKRGKA